MDEDNLYPEDYEEETIDDDEAEDEEEPIGYVPGVAFDYKMGDFLRDGRNMLMDASGVESWQQWCKNCLQTEQDVHLAYDEDFGINYEEVFSATSQEEAESILTREITEALDADPYERTSYIDAIDFEWTDPDAVMVSLTIVGIDDVTIDVEANIEKGES